MCVGAAHAQQSQAPPPQQPPPPQKEDSVAEAARKAKAAKEAKEKDKDKDKDATTAKPKAKKVFTDEDMSGLKSTISVVGQESSAEAKEGAESEAQSESGEAKSGAQGEAYWRGKARKLRDQMAAVDAQIEKLKEEIKKSGAAGFSYADKPMDPNQNYVWLHDRNAQLKQLEKRRSDLDTQMEALMEEGRKAGAQAGWFR
jgi:hypothetical protein